MLCTESDGKFMVLFMPFIRTHVILKSVIETITHVSLCQGAHAIILPINLVLKNVFLNHKSGKYMHIYSDGS